MFEETRKKFWIVWCPEEGRPQKKHNSINKARTEAKRLAKQHPGKSFIVMVADSSFQLEKATAIHYQ